MSHPTLAAALWPREGASGAALFARAAALVALGALAMALSARARIPYAPVPLTMQSFAAPLIGLALGWRLGGLALFAYLLEGLFGAPVFAGGAGAAHLRGLTGGFLVGMWLAALLAGVLAERGWDRRPLKLVALLALAHAAIFVVGLAWMMRVFDVTQAFFLGVAPFVTTTLAKMLLSAALVMVAWRVVGEAPVDRDR
ncbi:MAG: biotin transporter BioY [Rhizobiales bacterium]|nr:biotin transporter BioY [Hyphomicrobiales bacterium]